MPQRSRSRLRQLSLIGLLASVVGLIGLIGHAGYAMAQAAQQLTSAQDGLSSFGAKAVPTDGLRSAHGHVEEAQQRLGARSIDVLAALPVVGRTVDALRSVASLSEAVLEPGLLVSRRTPELWGDGRIDVAALLDLSAELDPLVGRARGEFDSLSARSTSLTPPGLGQAVSDVLAVAAPAVDGLERALVGTEVLHGLLGGAGSRSLLVALGNNAELRGSGGYVSSFATGEALDGSLRLGALQDVVAVADAQASAERVSAPDAYVEDFGALSGNTTGFRSWNMSPHTPDSSSVGAAIAGALLGSPPDVVVILDVPAIVALAKLGGGRVALPGGGSVSPADLQRALLVDTYAEPGTRQEARRAELQDAATATVTRLLGAEVSAPAALRTFSDLIAGRHLTVWSSRVDEQRRLEELGVAGAIAAVPGEDLLHISVNNIGANKLDAYVDRLVEVDAVVGRTHTEVVQRVTFVNNAPQGLVRYVAGRQRPGTVVSRVEFSLAPDADMLAMSIDRAQVEPGLHGGRLRQRVFTRLEVPRGATSVVEMRYRVPSPGGAYRLKAVPQALAEDAQLRLRVRPAPGGTLEDLTRRGAHNTSLTERHAFDRARMLSVRRG